MTGLERSRRLFEEYGRPLFLDKLPSEVTARIACGLAGHGSECFGFDDAVSPDHDYNDLFAVWLTGEDDLQYGIAVSRAFGEFLKQLPDSCRIVSQSSRGGERDDGIHTVEGFFRRHIGLPGVPENWREWLAIPEYALAEAVNGAIFYDGPGIMTAIRRELSSGMPEVLRHRKIAGALAVMAQSGQYNYSRCLKHHEYGAARLALDEFVRSGLRLIYLLNRRFMPYYKWSFRGARQLPETFDLVEPLEFLLTDGGKAAEKLPLIEDISAAVVRILKNSGLSAASGEYLENHAAAIMAAIPVREIRELPLFE